MFYSSVINYSCYLFLVSKEFTGSSIIDLIQQNWTGGLVAGMIIVISNCAIYYCIRGIHGGGRRLGVGGNKWSWGKGQRKETLVPLTILSIPGSRDGKDGRYEGKKEKKLKSTEPALPSQGTLQKYYAIPCHVTHSTACKKCAIIFVVYRVQFTWAYTLVTKVFVRVTMLFLLCMNIMQCTCTCTCMYL